MSRRLCEHHGRDIVAPEIGRTEITDGDLRRTVPGLPHQVGEARTGIARGGGEAGTQRMAGKPRRIQPRRRSSAYVRIGLFAVEQALTRIVTPTVI